jgi:hypothetical protein
MAYHHSQKSYDEIKNEINNGNESPQDKLDACAYSILVQLFSIIEPELVGRYTAQFTKSLNDKINKNTITLYTYDKTNERVAELLKLYKINVNLERIEKNIKLNHFMSQFKLLYFNGAASSPPPIAKQDLVRTLSTLLAHAKLANEPGEQCIAVAEDEHHNLYVTGNGLWSFGVDFPEKNIILEHNEGPSVAGVISELTPGKVTPWFSSSSATSLAFTLISPDIIAEYAVRSVNFISPTNGDSNGLFHCEMQLIDYLIEHEIFPLRRYIGVSKPCCTHCRNNLLACGLENWTNHPARGPDPKLNAVVAIGHNAYRDLIKIENYRKRIRELY